MKELMFIAKTKRLENTKKILKRKYKRKFYKYKISCLVIREKDHPQSYYADKIAVNSVSYSLLLNT